MVQHIRFPQDPTDPQPTEPLRPQWYGDPPPWIGAQGFSDSIDWSGEPHLSAGDYFPRLEALPEVGQRVYWRVVPPFVGTLGELSWAFFQPPSSAINGFPDHPEELSCSGVVAVRLLEVLQHDQALAWIVVQVERSIPLSELEGVFPSSTAGKVFPWVPEKELTESTKRFNTAAFGEWLSLNYSFEGNLGFRWIFRLGADGASLLVYEEWGRDWEAVGFGHRPLTADELDLLRGMLGEA